MSPRFLLQIRRGFYIARFHMDYSSRTLGKWLTASLMDKLDACKDDEARRLLLGLSK